MPQVQLTEDRFLNGRIVVRQPLDNYRAAVDSVLLAAAVPAETGQSVLELGCGAGVVFMCVATRVQGLKIKAVELQPQLAKIAQQNADTNAKVVVGNVHKLPASLKANSFDHVFANPPFHDPRAHSSSPKAVKNTAHATPDLAVWVKAAHGRLKHRGVFTLILRADRLDEVLGAMTGKFGGVEVLPIWPKAGQPAKRVIVRAKKDSKSPLALLQGLTLHEASGKFTQQAEDVLRNAHAL